MLSLRACRELRDAYAAGRPSPLAETGIADADLIAFAAERIRDPDRNIRVLMLRLLAHQRGREAMRAVLIGLRDDKNRVCRVAIQSCPSFLNHEEIVTQLVAIARDSKRKGKLRRRALSMLAGDEGRWRSDVTEPVASALRSLMDDSEYRFAILFGLVRLDLAERSESLLRQFAAASDSAESEMARRRLTGERVIHIDGYAKDEALQRRIMDTCDRAHGRMYYWLPRAGLE